MSATRARGERGLSGRGPEWIRPRESERPGRGRMRRTETTILILLGVVLAIATVNDVVRQTHINHRLVADVRTWRMVTGLVYPNMTTELDTRSYTTRDTVCGNTSPGGPKERTQLCLALVGPVIDGRRTITGGYYLLPESLNGPSARYSCFGAAAAAKECGLRSPPSGAPPSPPVRTGLP